MYIKGNLWMHSHRKMGFTMHSFEYFQFFSAHRRKIPLRMKMRKRMRMIVTKRGNKMRRKKETNQLRMISLKKVESFVTPIRLLLRPKFLKRRRGVRRSYFLQKQQMLICQENGGPQELTILKTIVQKCLL